MAFGLAPRNINSLLYAGSGLYFAPALPLNHAPTTHDRYPIITFAINKDVPHVAGNGEGDLWYLARYQGQLHNPFGEAIWIRLSGGSSGPLLSITVPNGVTEIVPNPVDGEVTFTSIDNSITITGSSASPNNHNIDFSVTAGTNPIESVQVDNADAPGVNPVTPNAGLLKLFGEIVQPNAGIPIRTETKALYEIFIQTQVTTTSTSGAKTINNAGLASFDSNLFLVDAATGFVTSTAIQPQVANLGISYAASTFTVNASDGSALSATNPAYITLQSSSVPGNLVTYKITANQSFIDDTGASTILGNLFGLSDAVDCDFNVPFYLYAVSNAAQNDISFMISRFPNSKLSPIAAKIGKTGSAIADTQGSFFALDNPTVANFAQTPCLAIGCFRMTKTSGAANDWTVTALTNIDGIGNFFENTSFAVKPGQFGTAAGTLFFDNGGTAPVYQNGGAMVYRINQKTNQTTFNGAFATNTTPGAGAVNLELVLPYVANDGAACGSGDLVDSSVPETSIYSLAQAPGVQFAIFNFTSPTASGMLLNTAANATSAMSLFGTIQIQFS